MQGLLIERIKTYFRQVREKMSTFDAYFTRGGELYNEKKYNLAVEFFKIALRQSNAENYAYYNLALAYQQLELDDKALENYKIFNQLVKEFYYLDEDEKENDNTQKEFNDYGLELCSLVIENISQ